MLKRDTVFLFHLKLSLLIPLLFSIVGIVLSGKSFSINTIPNFFLTFFFSTCSIPMFLLSFLSFMQSFSSTYIGLVVFIIAVLFRLSILVGFVFLHKNINKTAGIILDIIFIVINATFGFFFVRGMGLI
jgi:hypothetical protein